MSEREQLLDNVLRLILDQVDYTNGACGPTEMVAAVLPTSVIEQARAVLNHSGRWKDA